MTASTSLELQTERDTDDSVVKTAFFTDTHASSRNRCEPRSVDFIAALRPALSMLYHDTTLYGVHTYHEVAYVTD